MNVDDTIDWLLAACVATSEAAIELTGPLLTCLSVLAALSDSKPFSGLRFPGDHGWLTQFHERALPYLLSAANLPPGISFSCVTFKESICAWSAGWQEYRPGKDFQSHYDRIKLQLDMLDCDTLGEQIACCEGVLQVWHGKTSLAEGVKAALPAQWPPALADEALRHLPGCLTGIAELACLLASRRNREYFAVLADELMALKAENPGEIRFGL